MRPSKVVCLTLSAPLFYRISQRINSSQFGQIIIPARLDTFLSASLHGISGQCNNNYAQFSRIFALPNKCYKLRN